MWSHSTIFFSSTVKKQLSHFAASLQRDISAPFLTVPIIMIDVNDILDIGKHLLYLFNTCYM